LLPTSPEQPDSPRGGPGHQRPGRPQLETPAVFPGNEPEPPICMPCERSAMPPDTYRAARSARPIAGPRKRLTGRIGPIPLVQPGCLHDHDSLPCRLLC
jgi:hypothetical protein